MTHMILKPVTFEVTDIEEYMCIGKDFLVTMSAKIIIINKTVTVCENLQSTCCYQFC